jgi:hypothetical protein
MDTVAFLDNTDYTPIVKEAFLLKLSVVRDSDVMQHPLENGTSIVDHRVLKPVEINIQIVGDCTSKKIVYDKLKELYLQAKLITVQTRQDVYNDMLIQSMPHEENTNMMDAVAIALKLREVIVVQSRYVTSTKKPAQKRTVAQGTKQAAAPEGSVLSLSSPKTKALSQMIIK